MQQEEEAKVQQQQSGGGGGPKNSHHVNKWKQETQNSGSDSEMHHYGEGSPQSAQHRDDGTMHYDGYSSEADSDVWTMREFVDDVPTAVSSLDHAVPQPECNATTAITVCAARWCCIKYIRIYNVYTEVYYNFVQLLFSILYAQKWKLSIFLVILCTSLFLNPLLWYI